MRVSAFSTKYLVPQRLLDEARGYFQDRGRVDCEGTGLFAGINRADSVMLTRLIIPEQVAESTAWGACVDLTPRAHYTLPDLLLPGELYHARIHSHPARAYHSARDDANAVISHQGAISIVVPYFARNPIDLARCAIYQLVHGRGWRRLSAGTVRSRFEVVP